MTRTFLAMCLCPIVAVGAQRPVASVTLEPQGTGKDVVAVFAHPFRQGDIKVAPTLWAGGSARPAQVQVKRRYADGSVKHAIFAVPLADARPGHPLKLDFRDTPDRDAPQPAAPELPDGFEAEVVLRLPDGGEARARATEFLRKARARSQLHRLETWLGGPHVAEYQIQGPPASAAGADPDLQVIFGLRRCRFRDQGLPLTRPSAATKEENSGWAH